MAPFFGYHMPNYTFRGTPDVDLFDRHVQQCVAHGAADHARFLAIPRQHLEQRRDRALAQPGDVEASRRAGRHFATTGFANGGLTVWPGVAPTPGSSTSPPEARRAGPTRAARRSSALRGARGISATAASSGPRMSQGR